MKLECYNTYHHPLAKTDEVFDEEKNAVRIVAFSLYLEILNHLSNKQINESSFLSFFRQIYFLFPNKSNANN